MLLRLSIGRKLAGSPEFRLGFLRRGVKGEGASILKTSIGARAVPGL